MPKSNEYTYHVYFNPKPEFSDSEVSAIVKKFSDHQIAENLMLSYGLTKYSNKGSFPELSDYHFTANYSCKDNLDKAIAVMGRSYTEEPHLSLAKMAKEFRVAFSEELKTKPRIRSDIQSCSSTKAATAPKIP